MGKLISIDGSTTKTGYAVFDLENKKLEQHTVIVPENIKKSLSKKDKDGLTKTQIKDKQRQIKKENIDHRISEMIKELDKIFNEYHPEVIIMEDTYGNKDMYAYKKLCHLQGLVLSYCITKKVTFILKAPQSWRKDLGFEITENGMQHTREDYKSMSIKYIKDKYNIYVTDDEADAICLGLSFFKSSDNNNQTY